MNKKLGFYTIGTSVFESKIQACILANKVLKEMNQSIHPLRLLQWNFNDEVFEAYDWTKEPEKTLDELYNARARDIREKYDHVIVSYSGGADSHNMLMAFLRQNLFVDEIIVTHMNKAMNDYAIIDPSEKSAKYAYSSEYALQTIPRLKEISNLSPQTKIRIFDVSDSVFNAFARHKDESWIFQVREELNPIDASRYNYLQFPEFKKQLDHDKKTAIVLGVDKPKIRIFEDTKKVCMYFSDRMANITPIGEYAKDYTNTTIEYFYWSPDACDMICKQAHVIMNWLRINTKFQPFFHKMPKPLEMGRIPSERIIRPLLYTTWNSSWFQANKAMFDWYSEFDYWFIENHRNTIEYSLWKKGLAHVIKNCDLYIQNRHRPDALMTIEKQYFVGLM